jgi:crossover junction endodeoxyribonuclease RuvC
MKVVEKKERILGIDPGFGRIGFGVIEKNNNNNWKVVGYGCIETSPQREFIDRLDDLHKILKKVIKKYNPTRSAVEDLFFAKNVKTAIKVAQARGVILLTLRLADLEIDEFTPLQIKQTIVGYGRAEKRQVQEMLKINLNMKEKPKQDDAADALAVALTCGVSLKMKGLL